MAIANVVGRGYGPSASITFVVTRGFTIGAAILTPPNATLTTRGFGQNGSIAKLVTRFYDIGVVIIPVDHRTITDTDYVQRPVDYYMPELPQYEKSGNTYEAGSGKSSTKVRASGTSVRRLDGGSPSFTTTTNNRGYD